jgi:magnesium/cobalt transport protein CorA
LGLEAPGQVIRARLFDADGQDRAVEIDADLTATVGDSQLLWVDAEAPEPLELQLLAERFALQGDSVQSLADPPRRPALSLFPEYVQVIVSVYATEGGAGRGDRVSFFAGRNFVLAVHAEPVDFLRQFEERIKGDSRLGELDAPSFLASLLDAHVSTYFQIVEDLEATIDRLDSQALRQRTSGRLLDELVAQRHLIARVRRVLAPHRDVFAALGAPHVTLIAQSESAPLFVALAERLDRAIEAVENSRELLLGSFDIYMSRTAQRTNDVMKLLALATVILLPGSLLAGVMGMNFQVPLFEDANNFWLVVAAMAVIAVVVVVAARVRGWL